MRNNQKLKSILAILAMSFITLAASATSPALATISKSFPEASPTAIASIATLSSLTAVPCTILSGMIAGRRVRFRTLTALGLIVTFLGGLLPVFAGSIYEILLGRAILGVGTGLIAPLTSTLVLYLFSGDEVPKQLGRNAMATNVGAVIFQLLQKWGNVDWKEMYRTFNMGIGMILIVSQEEAEKVKAHLSGAGETVYTIGRVVRGQHDVTIKGGVFDGK